MVTLSAQTADGRWDELGCGRTDDDGRARNLLPDGHSLRTGIYRLRFDTAAYFHAQGLRGFFHEVAVTFLIDDPAAHHYVPLLLSPYGYSTYRGS